ncbi:hypothetical protein OAD67_01175 [bacterium]|nr:hypothetical protein [bacterium]
MLGRLAVDHRDGGLLATECLDLEGGKGVGGGGVEVSWELDGGRPCGIADAAFPV